MVKTPTLHLPSPASELFETVYRALHDFIRPITPGNVVGRLGGGTTLAAQWHHRRSTDIDITVPQGTGLNRYDPGRDDALIKRMEQLGAVRVSARYRTLIFEFPNGKLDIVEMELPIRKGERSAVVDGKPIAVHSNGQILSGKLVGRGNMNIARDVFDIAVAYRKDPEALQAAINHMEPGYREDVAYRLEASSALYRREAEAGILLVAPEWRPLLLSAPEVAAEAISALQYSSIELDFSGPGLGLRVRSWGDSEETVHRYQSAEALVDALSELGLEPHFLTLHGTAERIEEHINHALAARLSDSG